MEIRGRDIRAARIRLGVTQDELAKHMNMVRSVLVAIERETIVVSQPSMPDLMSGVQVCAAQRGRGGATVGCAL